MEGGGGQEEAAWTEQMHAAVNYVELLICRLVLVCFLLLLLCFPFCLDVSAEAFPIKFLVVKFAVNLSTPNM